MKKILLALFLLLIPTVVYADIGPKPSITINLKNMKGTNYKIDLLSDCSTKKDEIVSVYSSYKDEPIYINIMKEIYMLLHLEISYFMVM